MKKAIKNFSGELVGISAWLSLIICDAIDEIILDTGMCIGIFAFFLTPLVILTCYIVVYIKRKPSVRRLIGWHLRYGVVFSLLWLLMYRLIEKDEFFIYQEKRSDFIDLNGIEYVVYGFPALIAFIVLSLLFHIIYAIGAKVYRVHKDKKKSVESE